MRVRSLSIVIACAVIVAAGRRARAAEAEPSVPEPTVPEPSIDEPSIEEMFAEIEAANNAPALPAGKRPTSGPSSSGPASSPASRPKAAPSRAKPPGPDAKPPARSESVSGLVKKVEKRASECYLVLKRKKQNWEIAQLYIRLERFKKAAVAIFPMLKSRHTGSRQHGRSLDSLGLIELEYARVMREIGNDREALAKVEDHKVLFARALRYTYPPGSEARTHVRNKRDLVENYRENRSRVTELEAALAAVGRVGARGREPGPDARVEDKLWELAELCRPGHFKAELPLRWLTSLFRLVKEYPEHELVTRGPVYGQLYRAYRHHKLYEDCIETLKIVMERFPESEMVRRNHCLWEMAQCYSELGDLGAGLSGQGASAYRRTAYVAYRDAIGAYERFKKVASPEDSRVRPRRSEHGRLPSHADAAIAHARAGMASLSRR